MCLRYFFPFLFFLLLKLWHNWSFFSVTEPLDSLDIQLHKIKVATAWLVPSLKYSLWQIFTISEILLIFISFCFDLFFSFSNWIKRLRKRKSHYLKIDKKRNPVWMKWRSVHVFEWPVLNQAHVYSPGMNFNKNCLFSKRKTKKIFSNVTFCVISPNNIRSLVNAMNAIHTLKSSRAFKWMFWMIFDGKWVNVIWLCLFKFILTVFYIWNFHLILVLIRSR